MRVLLFILILLSYGLSAQQTIELCEPEATFTYSSNAGTPGTYIWTVENTAYITNSLTYTWNKPGEYQIALNFISDGGCKDSIGYTVTVIDCRTTTMWFPNAFTPNETNLNETWSPVGYNYTDLEYSIYNRWGRVIFTSNSESNPWDGTVKGEQCQQDVYVYVATWRSNDRQYFRKVGHIVLFR